MWLLCISLAVILVYVIVIVKASLLLPSERVVSENVKANVSVIVPCRNEAENIETCIRSIATQSVFNENIELIIVDDYSEDDTRAIVENIGQTLPLKLLNSKSSGKKAALLTGINIASHDLICTIDADCITPPDHLQIMTGQLLNEKLVMLCGPVNFRAFGWFEKLQQAESAAVVGISAAALNSGRPATCNGANLMFSKQAFFEAGAYHQHAELASGDDDLLMQSMYRKFKSGVRYCMHSGAVVETAAVKSFGNLLRQRGRWITKGAYYIFPWNRYLQLLVVAHLICFYVLIAGAVLSQSPYWLLPVAVKYVADIAYALKLRKVLKFNMLMVFLMPFYQFYIFILPLAGVVFQPVWKGRNPVSSKNDRIHS